MTGKAKCKILREVRRKIAEENDIEYITRDCTYQGQCRGTCPKCESELRYLEKQLEKRQKLGKSVTVAALAAGMSIGTAACTMPELPDLDDIRSGVDDIVSGVEHQIKRILDREKPIELEGDVAYVTEGAIAEPEPDVLEGEESLEPETLEGEPVEYVVELEGDVADAEADN